MHSKVNCEGTWFFKGLKWCLGIHLSFGARLYWTCKHFIGHATVLPSFKWTWKSLCNHATISTKFSFGYYSKTI
jgi:hypothetical protein